MGSQQSQQATNKVANVKISPFTEMAPVTEYQDKRLGNPIPNKNPLIQHANFWHVYTTQRVRQHVATTLWKYTQPKYNFTFRQTKVSNWQSFIDVMEQEC
jgi:hypothetical protein